MIPDEYKNLMKLLIEKTQKGKIHWVETDSSNEYMVFDDFGGFSILEKTSLISVATNLSGATSSRDKYYVIFFLDEEAKPIENFQIDVKANNEDYSLATNLYHTVHRHVHNIDKKLKTFIKRLEEDKEIGKNSDYISGQP